MNISNQSFPIEGSHANAIFKQTTCFFLLGDGVPTIFVAVAGRSNGLGPVMSGNTAYPVINCPPITPDWGAQDIWSSLRMPSGTN